MAQQPVCWLRCGRCGAGAQLDLPLWLTPVIWTSLRGAGIEGVQHSLDGKVIRKPVGIGFGKRTERSRVFYFTTWFLKV